MANNTSQSVLSIGYLKAHWGFLTTGFGILSGLFLAGLKIGDYNRSLDCKLERIEFERACDSRVEEEHKKCTDADLLFYKTKSQELENVIKTIGKHEK